MARRVNLPAMSAATARAWAEHGNRATTEAARLHGNPFTGHGAAHVARANAAFMRAHGHHEHAAHLEKAAARYEKEGRKNAASAPHSGHPGALHHSAGVHTPHDHAMHAASGGKTQHSTSTGRFIPGKAN